MVAGGQIMRAIFERFIVHVLVFSIGLGSPILAIAQTVGNPAKPAAQTTPKPPPSPGDPWPRMVTYQGATISIYQPQIESWKGNQLSARSAVKVKTSGTQSTGYGVIWFTAQTEVDKVNRVVTLLNFTVTKQSFPTAANNGYAYANAFVRDMPTLQTIPLDLLEADLAVTNAADQQTKYPLQNNPPQIIFSITPAVLALIDGAPVLRPSADKLQKEYYLALMDGWMQADKVNGEWSPAKHEPTKDLNKILQAAQAAGENQRLGNPEQSLKDAIEDGQLPTVFVMTSPAELLVTQGQPEYAPIPGTSLQYVTNTGSDIFLDNTNQTYYILTAGRWFQSSSLQTGGGWSYVQATSLPADFSKIPSYSPKASVLVSVPGTLQAKEAVIANSIPQTATITRAAAKLTVTYDGAPDFQPIQGTTLTYAVNTTTPVIYDHATNYYAVQNGVWFLSANPSGPWTVATSVPAVIYTIPPSSPIHYVTYVQVYGSTPNVVYVGYTPGYYGTVVSSDNVVDHRRNGSCY